MSGPTRHVRRPILSASGMHAPATPARPVQRRGFLRRLLAAITGGVVGVRSAHAAPQDAQPFIGEIMLWAGIRLPTGWAFCNGQLLSIADNDVLFSILGTTYGGDGFETFALPDLRGCAPVHAGQGPGFSDRVLGEKAGAESVTLTPDQLAMHTHPLQVTAANGASSAPGGAIYARDPAGALHYGSFADAQMTGALGIQGGSQPHVNLQPYLTIHYCISLYGIYPSRN